MTRSAVVLYGPPAVGKDTITGELEKLGVAYQHFRRLKAGVGRISGYRQVTVDDIQQLSERGEILYRNMRYGATYAVDRTHLNEIIDHGRIPVIHLGQVAGIREIIQNEASVEWLVVCLWCSRNETERRLVKRSDARLAERMKVWDETESDIRAAEPTLFSLAINTGAIEAERAARIIDACCRMAPQ